MLLAARKIMALHKEPNTKNYFEPTVSSSGTQAIFLSDPRDRNYFRLPEFIFSSVFPTKTS
jgi:hypothetical protein